MTNTEKRTVRVRSRDGWCTARHKKTLREQDSVKTWCGYVILPWGVEFGRYQPETCGECRRQREKAVPR